MFAQGEKQLETRIISKFWPDLASQGTLTYQCPSHQSILLNQGLIHELFEKKFQELAVLENKPILVGHFEIFLSKEKKYFCFILMYISQSFLACKVGLKFWWLPWFPAIFYLGQTFCTRVYLITAGKMLSIFIERL